MATVILALTGCVTHGTGTPSFTTNEDERFQTVHHFGASAAWWAQAVGEWDERARTALVDLLYDANRGIGLRIIRYNLGGGSVGMQTSDPLRTAETPEVAPGVFDWSRDAAALRVVDAAVARGAHVVLFANSPPARLTVTGAASGNGTASNLKPGTEREFAAYLVQAATELHEQRGWPIDEISPINEPQWDWSPKNGQEGAHYEPEQVRAVVSALVGTAIARRGAPFGISAPESSEMKLASNVGLLASLFGDGTLSGTLGHYAVHSYWSRDSDRRDLRGWIDARYPGLELWMTEWTEMQGGRDVGMDSALVLAQTVHEDMTIAEASSWQYWIALSPYDYHDGLIYIDLANRTYAVTKRLWALGQWSRFVAPEAVRIGIDAALPYTVLASAYENPDGSIVAVMVNKGEPVTISASAPGRTQMRVVVTSDLHDMEETYAGRARAIELEGRSISTIVFTSP